MDSLEQTVAALEHDGRLDSTGHFTISPHVEAKKYQKFLESEPALPILKMVQAGVALGARQVHIHASLTGWSARLVLARLNPGALECLRDSGHSLRTSESERRGSRHLRVGWQMAVAGGGRASLTAVGPTARLRWDFQDGVFEPEYSEQRADEAWVELSVSGGSGQWLKILKVFARRFHLQSVLTNRCCLCPVQIVLGGQAIRPHWPPPPLPPGYPFKPTVPGLTERLKVTRSLFSLVERWWLEPEEDRPRLTVPAPGQLRCFEVTGVIGKAVKRVRLERPWLEGDCHCASIQCVGAQLLDHQSRLVDPRGRPELFHREASGLIEELAGEEIGWAREVLQFGIPMVVPLFSRYLSQTLSSLQAISANQPTPDSLLVFPDTALNPVEVMRQTGVTTTNPEFVEIMPKRERWGRALYLSQALVLPAEPNGQSYLYAVMDGVLSDPVGVELAQPGLVAYAAANDLKTDLSQLKLVEDDGIVTLLKRFDSDSQEEVIMDAHRWLHPEVLAMLALPEQTRNILRKRFNP